MSNAGTDLAQNKEYRILRVMKRVLTDVVKDTTTKPGMIHPLSDRTIERIRQCLQLITERERELHEAAGIPMNMRPRFIDEPQRSAAVPLSKIKRPKDSESG